MFRLILFQFPLGIFLNDRVLDFLSLDFVSLFAVLIGDWSLVLRFVVESREHSGRPDNGWQWCPCFGYTDK